MKGKRGFEFSFAWLFSIIVGAMIIFLAIYATTNYVKTERTIQDTELGKKLGIILSPVETSLESGKTQLISFPTETRMYNDCSPSGTFGAQRISTATKSGVGEEWRLPGEISSFHNKYIFSKPIVQGNSYIVFSKPIELPFKIADLIYILSKDQKFCFVNPPREIEDELTSLRISNINLTSSISDCPSESESVCFTNTGCDIDVSYEGKSVKKKYSDRVYFETTSLLYGAIFSESKDYECQLRRLMNRASELSWIYYSKSLSLSSKGCNSNLEANLAIYANETFSIDNSLRLKNIAIDSDIIGRKNDDLSCKLF